MPRRYRTQVGLNLESLVWSMLHVLPTEFGLNGDGIQWADCFKVRI